MIKSNNVRNPHTHTISKLLAIFVAFIFHRLINGKQNVLEKKN
jgi:hypothetical protein